MTESTSFEEYLAVDESAVAVGAGTLFQATAWTPSAICVTDRRVLFVPAEGGFVDVPRRQVLSIRSRPTRRRTGRAIGGLVVLVAGAVLAALAARGVLTAGGLAVPALALLATAGTVATGWIVTREVELAGDHVSVALGRVETAFGTVLDRVEGRRGPGGVPDAVAVPPRVESLLVTVADEWPVLHWLAAAVGLLGAGGLVVLGAWTAIGLTAVGLVGIGTAAYGRAYVQALEADDRRIRRERSVCLYLLDGRTVRFRIDDDASIERELRTLTARGPAASAAGATTPAEDGTTEPGASTGP